MINMDCPKCNGLGTINNSEIKKEKLLLVEGMDDFRFFLGLLQHLNIDNVQIVEYGGKSKLQRTLTDLSRRPNYSIVDAIGITRDADSDGANTVFNKICDNLKQAKFSVPTMIGEFSNDDCKMGVFVLPNCRDEGELENLCLQAIESHPTMPCAKKLVACLDTNHQVKKTPKTLLYAWLTTHNTANLQIGSASKRNLFNFESEHFQSLSTFLKQLSLVERVKYES
ncbi:hypothetical protein BH10PSE19_BH10PSE19_22700 [soil metagenome]